MSYTEIYAFDKNGNAYFYDEIRNSWRGAMAIWTLLEAKYLPPYRPSYVPATIPDSKVEDFLGFIPRRVSGLGDENAMKEIWNLADDERLSDAERIVLKTTFDYVLVKKEDLPKVIDAFNSFEGNTSLKEQAEILSKMLNDENVIAVGWNQTSVNGDNWSNFGGYDEKNDESIPYNILTMNKHWFLF